MDIKKLSDEITDNISSIVYGKEREIRFVLCALFCRGHILLEDVPGTGKTTLARALAASVGADFKRIQFTPDLLPSDIVGVNVFDRKTGEFVFRPGPVFTNILLADEINRTTPRTQSALLECMQEAQATVDGKTYPIDDPFFVIATENPIESYGTFPLPEAQTDRFFMKIGMGYPDRKNEERMLTEHFTDRSPSSLKPVCSKEDIISACEQIGKATVSDQIREYILDLVEKTRKDKRLRLGASPRASLALIRASAAYAAVEGRDYVIPDDVKEVAMQVLAHRLIPASGRSVLNAETAESIMRNIIDTTDIPLERKQ